MIEIIVAIVITSLFAAFFVMSDSPKSTDIYWYDEKTGLAQCRKGVDIHASSDINEISEELPKDEDIIDSKYHTAMAKDLESYQKIMRDIAPEFDVAFDIVEKPKNAQYFRNKREKYIEKYIEENTPRWQREGREMCEAIIREIEEKVEVDPELKELCLLDQQFDWTNREVMKPHPYNLIDEESRKECDKCLTGLGFEVREYSFHTRVEW